ncbi:MAG: isoleucine--tRNA ligase [candidate division Zixibacteria bacterium]|nr:isoleucine--tRNA ligase [candidate division Zixibacteria bacterium]
MTDTTVPVEPDETVAPSTRASYGQIEEQVLEFWEHEKIFERSMDKGPDAPSFVFFEGPPTANGKPGIHHVIARTIKDLVCRYHTMKGFRVDRKAGWDTHGLPVEIEVERQLGLESKQKILEYGVDKFNAKCRESVFRYKEEWDRLTRQIGFWLDLKHPYVTLTNEYMETVWWILAQFFQRDLLYEGHKIVPYCPRCGTGLSSHEVALGYATVTDPSVTVTMPLADDPDIAFLVWTTTPWTLISNAALAVGANIDYVQVVKDGRRYILAEARLQPVLKSDFEIQKRFKGSELVGKKYKPIFPFFADRSEPKAFTVLDADFVSVEDGTGIVHMAPAFGADDYEVGRRHGLPVLQPVRPDGTFDESITPYAGQFVKDADKQIIKDLRAAGRLYDAGQIEHTYPFCWRCDTPLLYYARRSWYIRTSQFRERLLALNRQVHWYPPEIGAGRFGEWLENNVDWALSRERFWGTPLPIWVCEGCDARTAVESIADLKARGSHLPEPLDLHKPHVDDITLTCDRCQGVMRRVPDVIDVWFDSGAMPFAQWHYPFENKDRFDRLFPADFISEAVDQTRGWFYSLHAIAVLLTDTICYRNCLVMEFIVDKQGRKMSKSRGNVVDPWEVINADGADALRWYLLSASQPWLPTRFDPSAVTEVRNRFFDTWKNTLAFYRLYAEIDGVDTRGILEGAPSGNGFDRWLASRTATVNAAVDKAYADYDLTRAVRMIADFVVDDVSNWYVRLNRRRFWASGQTEDKREAFATLARTLLVIARMAAPAAPFFAEHAYRELLGGEGSDGQWPLSVHLCEFPRADTGAIDQTLETRMAAAQRVVGLGRAARAKARLKTRQPLAEAVVVHPSDWSEEVLAPMNSLIAAELNVKRVNVRASVGELAVLSAKPNFAALGARMGNRMKTLAGAVAQMDAQAVDAYRRAQSATVTLDGETVTLGPGDLQIDIRPQDGYHVESEGSLLVGIDTRLDETLKAEGYARELINRVQNTRKKMGLLVTDRIALAVSTTPQAAVGIRRFADKIKDETMAVDLSATEGVRPDGNGEEVDLNGEPATITITPCRV